MKYVSGIFIIKQRHSIINPQIGRFTFLLGLVKLN